MNEIKNTIVCTESGKAKYDAARRLSSQLKSINNSTNYGCLQKVYSIFICMGNVPDYEAGTATLYGMTKHDIIGNIKRTPDEYDLLNVIILRINDRTKTEDEVLLLLQVLCSNLISKEEKLERLRKHGIRLDEHIEEGVESMCNLSDLVEARGELRGKQKMTLRMLKDGFSYENAAKYAEVTVETIKEWEEEALSVL